MSCENKVVSNCFNNNNDNNKTQFVYTWRSCTHGKHTSLHICKYIYHKKTFCLSLYIYQCMV